MHNVEYFNYPLNVNRKDVQRELDELAAHADFEEGCTGLGSPIRWLDGEVIMESYEAAQAKIEELDMGWYDQLAVRYYEHERPIHDEKLIALKAKSDEAYKKFYHEQGKWLDAKKPAYITCKVCNSRLNASYIHYNNCPLCCSDLRSESAKAAVEKARIKWAEADRKVREYIVKHGKQTTRWLVKIEYHT